MAEFVGPGGSALAGNPLFSEVDQPGAGPFPVPGPVARAKDWGDIPPRPAPALGADAPGVLSEWLGTTPAGITDLRRAGIIDWAGAQAGYA